MGHTIDKTYIQMRMLNTGKGPAVRALRAQADRHAYHRQMKLTLEKEPNLTLRQGTVDDLIVEDGVCKGVITNTVLSMVQRLVVLTVGTAARGKIIIGELQYELVQITQRAQIVFPNVRTVLGLIWNVLRLGHLHESTETPFIMMKLKSNQVIRNLITSALIHQTVI